MEVTRLEALARSITGTSSRRGLARGVAASAIALAIARLPGEVDAKKKRKKRKKKVRADAICPGPINDAFGIVDVNARLAQTFTAIASGKLVKAELRLTEPPGSLGDYILRLSPVDAAGVPTNIILAESQLLDINVPNGQSTVTFTFEESASVQAGTDYALVVTRAGSDKLVWAGHIGNSCTGVAYMSPSQNAAFVAVGNIDFVFTTFVKS